MKGQVKFLWSNLKKKTEEVINKLKFKGFHASSLSTYDFALHYTALPH